MNKLNKLSASHGAALFLFRSLFQLAKVIFSSKSLTKSSFIFFLGPKHCFVFGFFGCYGQERLPVFTQALDKQLSEVSNTHSNNLHKLVLFDFAEIST